MISKNIIITPLNVKYYFQSVKKLHFGCKKLINHKINKIIFQNYKISDEFKLKAQNKDEKRIVNIGNHIIKYSSLRITILLEIINKEKASLDSILITKQIIAILYNVL